MDEETADLVQTMSTMMSQTNTEGLLWLILLAGCQLRDRAGMSPEAVTVECKARAEALRAHMQSLRQ